ncbi:uncharacterized protein LOC132313467 [Cornus florida]|uniref:uncharacterized protein LOC132313467 n=1 Tax=Cornus florida TaxID=4283 RepID=UPI00289F889E|nr:uncharacterized protein LOC132313467 [Cornus florida]
MLLPHKSVPDSVTHSRFNTKHACAPITQLCRHSSSHTLTLNKPTLITLSNPSNCHLNLITRCRHRDTLAVPITSDDNDDCNLNESQKPQLVREETQEKSFWGAVSLIIGTAVGPGMLGLPAATMKSGPLPSVIAILVSWIYVISSIILVAELSFAAMEEDDVSEVSFTGLATKAVGSHVGAFVAIVYASLSFSLLVACVAGIGSIVSQLFPWVNPLIAHALLPSVVGIILWFFPFKIIDAANRFLCFIMLFSITALVVIGLSVARSNLLYSFTHAAWDLSSILPAIPVTVLTLGFHVITPFICRIAGNTVDEARKAILFGGFVPLVMVLSWNLIVLGLAGTESASPSKDPISLLLSVNSLALPAVQGFAFSALATSLIGYAVSFPKQVLDTLELIFGISDQKVGVGKVGCLGYSGVHDLGKVGKVSYTKSICTAALEVKLVSASHRIVMPLVLGVAVLIASFCRSTFSRALDFAGTYANCFLFGILPPIMAYIYQFRKKQRSSILPGGEVTLLVLFVVAVILFIWH